MTGRWTLLIVTVVLGFLGVQMLTGADIALEKSIEKAKERRDQDIEKASAAYYRQVEKAQSTLAKTYESAAGAAKRKKDDRRADLLTAAAEKVKAGESVDAASIAAGDPQIEAAAKRYATEVEAAERAFKQAVERAGTTLEQAYSTAITGYKRKSDPRADELATELASIKAQAATPTRPAPPGPKAGSGNPELVKALGDSLIDAQGKPVSAKGLSNQDYVLLFFSAAWCDTCRERTRELVAFHSEHASKLKFEIVFVSSCKSEAEMLGYMTADKMPWPAVAYSKVDSTGLREKYNAVKVPLLVVLDREGKMISKPNVYAEEVLKDFKMKMGVK